MQTYNTKQLAQIIGVSEDFVLDFLDEYMDENFIKNNKTIDGLYTQDILNYIRDWWEVRKYRLEFQLRQRNRTLEEHI